MQGCLDRSHPDKRTADSNLLFLAFDDIAQDNWETNSFTTAHSKTISLVITQTVFESRSAY